MYYVLLAPGIDRQKVLERLKAHGINAVFHYVPLHSAPGGMQFGRQHGSLEVTDSIASRLIRLPLWIGLTREQQDLIVSVLSAALDQA